MCIKSYYIYNIRILICSGCGHNKNLNHSVTTQAVFLPAACEFMVIPKVLLGQVGCNIPLGHAQYPRRRSNAKDNHNSHSR